MHIFSEIRPSLMKILEQWHVQDLIITGHSLGAALATLASIELASTYNVTTYVFASPRVCDHLPTTSIRNFWRVNNASDIVTQLPLSVMPNLEPEGTPFFYSHGGNSVDFNDNRHSIVNNHLLPVYIDALDTKKCHVTSV